MEKSFKNIDIVLDKEYNSIEIKAYNEFYYTFPFLCGEEEFAYLIAFIEDLAYEIETSIATVSPETFNTLAISRRRFF